MFGEVVAILAETMGKPVWVIYSWLTLAAATVYPIGFTVWAIYDLLSDLRRREKLLEQKEKDANR